jgi:hypothetical protein
MRRPDPAQLPAIAAIRAMQAAAARGDAAKASAVLDTCKSALADSEKHRDAVVESWQAALSAPSLAIETLPLWAQDVMRKDAQVRVAEQGIADARTELDARVQDYQTATKRSDVAHDFARRTAKDRAAEREEAALHSASDLYLQRRRTP